MRGITDREAFVLAHTNRLPTEDDIVPVPDEDLPIINGLVFRKCLVFHKMDFGSLAIVSTPLGKLALGLYNAGCR
jgi:hypothetical protein